jgi:hypothetical protein
MFEDYIISENQSLERFKRRKATLKIEIDSLTLDQQQSFEKRPLT